jgi:hypothetical protein
MVQYIRKCYLSGIGSIVHPALRCKGVWFVLGNHFSYVIDLAYGVLVKFDRWNDQLITSCGCWLAVMGEQGARAVQLV